MGGVSCTPQAPVDPTKYTITFDSQGGSEVAAQEVAENVAATAPEVPTKDGYTFVEWLSGETAYDWTAPVTGNLTLTAKWTPTEYKITYLPEGVETDNPTTYTIETETFELNAPTNQPVEGKPNFVAWHKGEKPTEGNWDIVDSIEKGTTGDLTIVAEFSDKEQITITITGDLTVTRSVGKGDPFAGETGYDLFYEDGTALDTTKAVDAPLTLKAKAKKMTVKFDSNGGSAVAEAKVDYNTAVAKPTDPTLDGSTFQGWTLDGKAYDFNAKVTKDITLKATWKANAAEEP
ncbi:MAG: InlB B-repeat-containing protein, partial [Treponema sp.]|nr:InlB B-repeat-containing protein [Treponema sp.]